MQTFDRGDDPANEICESCKKHIRNHYGGAQCRCYPEEEMPKGSKRLDVYTIIDTGEGRSLWRKIGGAFVNRDDSLTVVLDAFPVNGRLHIRENKDDRDQGGTSG